MRPNASRRGSPCAAKCMALHSKVAPCMMKCMRVAAKYSSCLKRCRPCASASNPCAAQNKSLCRKAQPLCNQMHVWSKMQPLHSHILASERQNGAPVQANALLERSEMQPLCNQTHPLWSRAISRPCAAKHAPYFCTIHEEQTES